MIKKILIFACIFVLFSCNSNEEYENIRSKQTTEIPATVAEFTKFVTSHETWNGPLDFTLYSGTGNFVPFKIITFKINPIDATSLIVTDTTSSESVEWKYCGTAKSFNDKEVPAFECNGIIMWVDGMHTWKHEGITITQFQLGGDNGDGRTRHYIYQTKTNKE